MAHVDERHSTARTDPRPFRGRRIPLSDGDSLPPGLHCTYLDDAGPVGKASPVKQFVTGSKLRSGITLTFPEDRPDTSRSSSQREASSSSRSEDSAEGTTQRKGFVASADRPGKVPRRRRRNKDQNRNGGEVEDLQGGASPVEQSSKRSTPEEELEQQMQQLKLEKDRAHEMSQQMAQQAEALMHDRAKIKAERDSLALSQEQMAARLQLLEGMVGNLGLGPDDDADPAAEL